MLGKRRGEMRRAWPQLKSFGDSEFRDMLYKYYSDDLKLSNVLNPTKFLDMGVYSNAARLIHQLALGDTCTGFHIHGADLVKHMTLLCRFKRVRAWEALQHSFFHVNVSTPQRMSLFKPFDSIAEDLVNTDSDTVTFQKRPKFTSYKEKYERMCYFYDSNEHHVGRARGPRTLESHDSENIFRRGKSAPAKMDSPENLSETVRDIVKIQREREKNDPEMWKIGKKSLHSEELQIRSSRNA